MITIDKKNNINECSFEWLNQKIIYKNSVLALANEKNLSNDIVLNNIRKNRR